MVQKVRASYHMSRSDIALPLPFPPTELQVMMSELANGICASKNLILLRQRLQIGYRARWAPCTLAVCPEGRE